MSSKPSLLQKQQPKFKLGQAGEQLAAQFLQNQQFQIISRNLRWKQLEVDLIALDPSSGELVFVEVKTRKSAKVPAYLAVNHHKLQALRRFAALYTSQKAPHRSFRIDVICVTKGAIDHYTNVTWWR